MRDQQRLLRRLEQGLARSRRQERGVALLLATVAPPESRTEAMEHDLQALLRCEDDLLLVGPDGLAVVAEDLRHVSDVLRISARLRERAGRHQGALRLGMAYSASTYDRAEAMLADAQAALASLGPDEVERLADPGQHQEACSRIQLEADLVGALDRDELQVFYQPIVELAGGRVCGFEALVRWPHPRLGMLLPDSFLGLAAESGLMLRLDRLVVRRSLERLREWSDRRPVRLSINLCADHFSEPAHTDTLLTLLQGSGAPLGHLRLDVTEEVVLEESRHSALKRLREVNIGFHLDSYGVGSSSFLCLRNFPFECLKVDRSLIFQMESEESCELIASLLKVAASMRMRTIAEGVTTHAQLEELRSFGCREAQGYLFSAALDHEGASRLLAEDPRW